MAITVDWYKRFGESWWGDITKVLTPFPTVAGTDVIAGEEPVEDIRENMLVDSDDQMTLLAKKRKIEGNSTGAQAVKV
jgi:dTDP-glucose 4,6-dehydratase